MSEEVQNLPIRKEIEAMTPQFKAALPPHIPVERFVRIVVTAINGDPTLLEADRRSLFESAIRCAQDGLLPDKREAAFVVYNTKTGPKDRPVWIKKVQYIPMVWGIVKKVRNSGDLSSLTAHVVYENDDFDYSLGDDEQIHHKPKLNGARGAMTLAYMILKTKDGGIYREIMTRDEIMAAKEVSKAKDTGPWSGPFEAEMWKKTVIKRGCKRAPVSTDVETLLERDDELVDVDKLRSVNEREPIPLPKPLKEKADVRSAAVPEGSAEVQKTGDDLATKAAEVAGAGSAKPEAANLESKPQEKKVGRPKKEKPVESDVSTQPDNPPATDGDEKPASGGDGITELEGGDQGQAGESSITDQIIAWIENATAEQIKTKGNFASANFGRVPAGKEQGRVLETFRARKQWLGMK